MKTSYLKLLLSIGLLSQLTHAATSEEVVVIKKKSAIEVFEDSSEANRINKKGSLTLGLFGVGPNFAPAQTISGGLYIDRNKLVLLELKSGKGVSSRSAYQYSSEQGSQTMFSEAKSEQIGLHYKQFTGNSFYFRSGADYNKVDYKYDFSMSYYDKARTSSFSGESIVASFVIGNQWQWDNFTLGCDWIGVAAPIYSKITSAEKPKTTYQSDKDAFEEDKGFYLTSSSAILLRFYLGASF